MNIHNVIFLYLQRRKNDSICAAREALFMRLFVYIKLFLLNV